MASVAQVGWGFNGAMLCAVIRGSEFLTSLTIGLGAQINDADLEAVSRLCPHLQRLELRFAMVSDSGMSTSQKPCVHMMKSVQLTANKSSKCYIWFKSWDLRFNFESNFEYQIVNLTHHMPLASNAKSRHSYHITALLYVQGKFRVEDINSSEPGMSCRCVQGGESV